MNQDPPEELAKIVKKNAKISVRGRLQKLCDTIMADATGLPVQSDIDTKQSALITRQLIPLRALARSAVRAIDPEDELICLRVCTEVKEYFLMWDEDFLLASIQKIESSVNKDVTARTGYNPKSPRIYG